MLCLKASPIEEPTQINAVSGLSESECADI
jgi:hypothetical protein